MVTPEPIEALSCGECRREQLDGERGWRAFLAGEEDEPDEVLVFCRACAEREFGPAR